MKKIGLICLAMVVALGGLGAAYAMWFDTVMIETTVKTGSVDVDIMAQKSNDPGPHGVPGQPRTYFEGSLDPAGGHQGMGDGFWSGIGNPLDPTNWTWVGTRYEKNVASCDCEFGPIPAVPGDAATDQDYLTIRIDNAYPCYGPDVAFGVLNNGSVPVKIYSMKLVSVTTPQGTFPVDVDVDCDLNTTAYMVANDGTVTKYTNPDIPFPAGWDDDYAFSFNITSLGAQPLLHTQFEPGDGLWGDVGVHVAQSAVQSAEYSFTLVYTFCNWNEIP